MKQLEIKKNDAGQRLDKFLLKSVKNLPSSLMYKSVRKGRIKINGKKTTDASVKLCEGDVLSLYINDEFFSPAPLRPDFFSASDTLDIVYEDENIILLNKPVSLAVHDYDGSGFDTLINRILKYLYNKKEYDYENEASFIPALCNRIDLNTCGIVIAAKTAEALREMNDAIKERRITKKYLCMCHSCPSQKSGEIRSYMKKIADKNICLVSDTPKKDYKTAISRYRVLKSSGVRSLLEIKLETGRTHQIRAQLAHIGCPLMGDGKYGTSYADDKASGFPYQALCSYKLSFDFKSTSPLYYLNGKTFELKDIWFKDKL